MAKARNEKGNESIRTLNSPYRPSTLMGQKSREGINSTSPPSPSSPLQLKQITSPKLVPTPLKPPVQPSSRSLSPLQIRPTHSTSISLPLIPAVSSLPTAPKVLTPIKRETPSTPSTLKIPIRPSVKLAESPLTPLSSPPYTPPLPLTPQAPKSQPTLNTFKAKESYSDPEVYKPKRAGVTRVSDLY